MKDFLDWLIPRFLTERTAFELVDDEYYAVCPMEMVPDGVEFDAVGTVRCFNLFGIALFGSLVGELEDWPR